MTRKTKIETLLVSPHTSLREVIEVIDAGATGIALVIDEVRHLVGTITDGDVRRAILAHVDLAISAGELLQRSRTAAHPKPTVAPVGTPREELIELLRRTRLRHVPLLDQDGRLADLAVIDELIDGDGEALASVRAVVMAGGFGRRLQPLTDEVPKPMLPVGNRPLLERTVTQLRGAGVRNVSVTTHYKPEVITEHFKDGRDFGVHIQYVEEDTPLGTAGALRLIDAPSEPLLVINGDILTRVDFRAMYKFHHEHAADMTVGVRQYEIRVPYGVVEADGPEVRAITEKPTVRHFINAGIYLLAPGVTQRIPPGEPFDMPDLVSLLLTEGRRVISFPIREYWLDIGKHEDYERANLDAVSGKV